MVLSICNVRWAQVTKGCAEESYSELQFVLICRQCLSGPIRANRFSLRTKQVFFCESTSQKMDSSEERTRITRMSMRIGEKTRFTRIWPSASDIVFLFANRSIRANLQNVGVRIACPLRSSLSFAFPLENLADSSNHGNPARILVQVSFIFWSFLRNHFRHGRRGYSSHKGSNAEQSG